MAARRAPGDQPFPNRKETPMRDLIVWLSKVLDDDEQAAKAAADIAGHTTWTAFGLADGPNPEQGWTVEAPDGSRLGGRLLQRMGHHDLVTHVACHDPEAVLADIEAKRAIINAYTTRADIGVRGGLVNRDPLGYAVRALASAYRHKPGWKQEWEQ